MLSMVWGGFAIIAMCGEGSVVVVECVVGLLDGSLDEVCHAFRDELEAGFAVVYPVLERGSDAVGEQSGDGQGVTWPFGADGVT